MEGCAAEIQSVKKLTAFRWDRIGKEAGPQRLAKDGTSGACLIPEQRQAMTIRAHLILWKFPYNRAKDTARNNLLRKIHIAVGFICLSLMVYASFFNNEATEGHGLIYFLSFMTIQIIFAFLVIAGAIMLIPSWLFAKAIGPEIILTDDQLIYLGGSNAIKDSPTVLFYRFFIYLEGVEDSLILNKNDIKEIFIFGKRDLFTKFKFNTMEKEFISITHTAGRLLIGGAYIDPHEFIERLRTWHQSGKEINERLHSDAPRGRRVSRD